MVFWIILSTVLSLDKHQYVCYGHDFTFRRAYVNRRYAEISFTPSNPAGPTRIIVQNGTVQDSRYELEYGKFVVPGVMEKDEGKFILSIGRDSALMEVIILKVEDCSQRKQLFHGDDFYLELSSNTAVLQFSEEHSPSQFVTLWNKALPMEGKGHRGRVRGRSWIADKVTYADQGYYTQRNGDGRFMSRHYLHIQAREDTFVIPNGASVTFILKIPPSQVQLYFEPADGTSRQQLVRDGWVLHEYNSFTNRLRVEEGWIEIEKMGSSDIGLYQIENPGGKVVYSAEVDVEAPVYLKYLPLIGILFAVVILCLCIRKICCKKSTQAPIRAQPVVHGEVSSSTYPLNPSVPSHSQWSGTQTNVPSKPESTWKPGTSTTSYALLMDSVSRHSPARERASSHVTQELEQRETTTPSFPLNSDVLHSSDAGIQFDIRKGRTTSDYFATLPLNADTSETCSVYTSSKLDFL